MAETSSIGFCDWQKKITAPEGACLKYSCVAPRIHQGRLYQAQVDI